MTDPAPPADTSRRAEFVALVVLIAAFAIFGWAATLGWSSGNLPGNEFRQTQTALSAYFIDQDNNFALAYPTPVLGRPWSIPMEAPLYQWATVIVHRTTGLPLLQSGRLVSLVCVVFGLPALCGLLRRLRLPLATRRLTAALYLLVPLHVFYGRGFLIETMALMFSLWFLHAFVRSLRTHSPFWFALATLAGTAAGLAKVTTFLVYLVPAAVWGAFLLQRTIRRHDRGWRPTIRVLTFGLGPAVPALLVAWSWVRFADHVKATNPSADFLLSANLAGFNFGHGFFGERFAPETWRALARTWDRGILPWAVIATLVLGGMFVGKRRWRLAALAAVGLFLLVQLTFPLLYSIHEYYFVACATLPIVAAGCVLAGIRSRLRSHWVPILLTIGCLAGEMAAFQHHYRPLQELQTPGGSGLTEALRAFTPPQSVLVVSGDDWSAVIPYYSRRKALMVRSGLGHDLGYLERSFQALAGEQIGALVLVGDERNNTELAARAAGAFDLDPQPTFRHTTADVYLSKPFRNAALTALQKPVYDQISPSAAPSPETTATADGEVTPAQAATLFSLVSPAPLRAVSQHAFQVLELEGRRVLFAHPDSNLLIAPPAGATRIEFEFGMMPRAYTDPKNRSNGVEFIIEAEMPDGSCRRLFRRVLDPVRSDRDRGVQSAGIAFAPAPGETVVFRTRKNGNGAFDWAFWGRISVR